MKTKKFIIASILGIAILFSGLTPNITKAACSAGNEITCQINALMDQIKALQAQIAQLQAQQSGQTWCHTFSTNLRIGDQGSEVEALQLALGKDGDLVYDKNTNSIFDEYNASAVVAFQEKYASEILTPYKLKRGTGYVGPSTRAKLNKLYGCGQTPTTKSVTVLYPNGGEALQIGKTYTIKWQSTGFDSSYYAIVSLVNNKMQEKHTISAPMNSGSLDWTVPAIISDPNFHYGEGDVYTIMVSIAQMGEGNLPVASDASNNSFSITSAAQPSITITSPSAGQNFSEGDTIIVNWIPTNSNIYEVDLSPVISSNLTFRISGGKLTQPNTSGTASYKIDNTVPSGSYYITLYYTSDGSKWVKSQTFNITTSYVPPTPVAQPSITVTSPNGGETLVPGQTYTITWNTQKISQVFDIAIKTSGISSLPSEASQSYEILMSSSFAGNNSSHMNTHTVIKNLDANTKSYSWTVPTDITFYKYNKIIVMGTPTGCESGGCGGPVLDWSDNAFSIVSQ